MHDLISKIKDHYSLAAMVAPYTDGLRPPQQTAYGQYVNGWCPWCQNGTKQRKQARRFWVNIDTGLCNCYHPTCKSDKPMDIINFWARMHQITNQQAIRDLQLGMSQERRETA